MNAIKFYRIANTLYKLHVPLLPGVIRFIIFFLYNSTVPAQCEIGRDSLFGHGGIGVVLHPKVVIGKRVLIGQGVTLGGNFGSGPPTIHDDVWIGPGARILGDVTVGRNTIIGANAVVTKDVAENSVIGGVPGKLIKTLGPGQLDVLHGALRQGMNNRS